MRVCVSRRRVDGDSPSVDAFDDWDQERVVQTRTRRGLCAEGYGKATGKIGVCIATSGPGATNLVTGLADALLDSVPMVAITGQVPRAMIGTDVQRGAPIVEITRQITKHNYLVMNVEEIPRIIREAFFLAASGRPGPVLVDIPKDVQQQMSVPYWSPKVSLNGYLSRLRFRRVRLKSTKSWR